MESRSPRGCTLACQPKAPRSPFYDYALVQTAIASLRRVEADALASRSPRALTELVRTLINRSFASLNDPRIYDGIGLPEQVEALLEGVARTIDLITDTEWGAEFGPQHKSAFVASAHHMQYLLMAW